MNIQPGDWAVGPIGGPGGVAIGVAEMIANGFRFEPWEHALVYIGHGKILQAEPGREGAQIRPLSSVPEHFIWSTGILRNPNTDEESAFALGKQLEHTPYSALDYFALAALHAHIPYPHLRKFIEAEGHMQCAQLVDFYELKRGWHLFTDHRQPGDVMPYDLGRLLVRSA